VGAPTPDGKKLVPESKESLLSTIEKINDMGIAEKPDELACLNVDL